MAAKKKVKSKKSSPRNKVAPRKAVAAKTKPRKAVRSASKAKPAKVARAKRSKAARAQPAKKVLKARPRPPKAQKKAQRPRSLRPRSSSNGVHRRDRAGHLDPRYAAELRAKSREGKTSQDEPAFVSGSRAKDDLAEGLGEEAVETMTSGENENAEPRDEFVDEEVGGPFVESPAKTEFGEDSDESNPADATREPFPKT
jgi:hypothetical protein